jgi:pyrimidine-nucleoside phosphorylase
MRAVDIIRKKRDGEALSRGEIDAFVRGATSGEWPDYQVAALLMAIVLRGMTAAETADLTAAMVNSGVRLDLSDIPGPKVDKHSTGGVGDKTSLVVVPLAAACGVIVPKMSGRGLDHTGGTLDKLEAIPGFRVRLSLEEYRANLRAIGCALVGQTADIAPADKALYARRDVTATVDSIPLIAASVMSKKLAEGLDAVVLDVKCGRGAFMKTPADARRLAEALVAIGTANHVRTRALVTDMDQPLGRAVGNSLEVIEALDTLKGKGPPELEVLALEIAAHMIQLGGLARSDADAEMQARSALASGQALERFRRLIEDQGGNPRVVEDYSLLPTSPHRAVVTAERAGFVEHLDAERIGRATMLLGAGRDRVTDTIDPAVGAIVLARRGDRVRAGDRLIELHYRADSRLGEALALAQSACRIADEPPPARPLVLAVVAEQDTSDRGVE